MKKTFGGGLEKRKYIKGLSGQAAKSHLVMGIIIETTDLETQSQSRGKLSFIDLAGSERLKKT